MQIDLHQKDVFVFDLDGTLAASKTALDDAMAHTLAKILITKNAAIVSGGDFAQFKIQVVDRLLAADRDVPLEHLYIFPTSGARMYAWKGEWQEVYAEYIPENDRATIIQKVKEVLATVPELLPQETPSDAIEDRLSQITFSAFGQHAPLSEKLAWDPDRSKRAVIAEKLQALLPNFEVRLGGSTSVDIVKKGINKAYAVEKLVAHLGTTLDRTVYLGDALFEGGNDFVVRSTGVDCIQVENPAETLSIIGQV